MQNDLVPRLRARDPRAFRELFDAQRESLRRVAVRVTRDANAAEDVMQDAWVQVVRNIDRFEERSLLTTWLHRIVFNAALMYVRRERKFVPPTSADAILRAETTELSREGARGIDEEADDRVLLRRIEEVMRRLPETYREALTLASDDLPMREMAQQARSTEPAMKTRLHRARRALRAELATT